MRTHGTLCKWNDDRGFGFIALAQGGDEIFVHISAFPRDGVRPQLNELLSFEVETAADGKKRAARVMRTRAASTPLRKADHRHSNSRSMPAGWALGTTFSIAIFIAIGAYTYSHFQARNAKAPAAFTDKGADSRQATHFSCDGRQYCSQMRSCEEAEYFIRNCPDTKMDGNGDGIPCERQWCN
jgi:cold shock CspA family protein